MLSALMCACLHLRLFPRLQAAFYYLTDPQHSCNNTPVVVPTTSPPHPGIRLGGHLLPPATVIHLPFGRCYRLPRPRHPTFKRRLAQSYFGCKSLRCLCGPAGEIAVVEHMDVSVVVLRSVDLVSISVFFEDSLVICLVYV